MAEGRRPRANKPTPEPGARRAEAIVRSLREGNPSSAEVYEAFFELDALPPDEVRDALAAWVGPLPDLDRLDAETRRRLGLPLKPLRLRAIAIAKDADVLDVGPVAEEQLRIAGKTWDGADLAPEERLDGELEGSFAGTLERRVLADVEAPEVPVFDVISFLGDSGVVFAAGTTKVVALIAYHKVEMRDRRTRVAIEAAMGETGVEAKAQAQAQAQAQARAQAEAPAQAAVAAPLVKRAKKAAKKVATKRVAPAKKRADARPKTRAAKAVKTVKKPAKKSVTAKKGAKKSAKKK